MKFVSEWDVGRTLGCSAVAGTPYWTTPRWQGCPEDMMWNQEKKMDDLFKDGYIHVRLVYHEWRWHPVKHTYRDFIYPAGAPPQLGDIQHMLGDVYVERLIAWSHYKAPEQSLNPNSTDRTLYVDDEGSLKNLPENHHLRDHVTIDPIYKKLRGDVVIFIKGDLD